MIEIELKDVCSETFIRFLCDKCTFISFRIDGWKKINKKSSTEKLFKQMEVYLVEEYYDNSYLDSLYGNSNRILKFYMNPIFREYIINNFHLDEWEYPRHPEDPAFYREDGKCMMHVNVHEGSCSYYPLEQNEVEILKHLNISCGEFR